MDAGTQGTGDAALRRVRAKRSVKTSTRDISVADDALGDWDFEGNGADGRGKRWVLRGACQATRPEVIASTEVPREDISALRDVEGDAPVRPLRDGWAAWATEGELWLGCWDCGDIEFSKQL